MVPDLAPAAIPAYIYKYTLYPCPWPLIRSFFFMRAQVRKVDDFAACMQRGATSKEKRDVRGHAGGLFVIMRVACSMQENRERRYGQCIQEQSLRLRAWCMAVGHLAGAAVRSQAFVRLSRAVKASCRSHQLS